MRRVRLILFSAIITIAISGSAAVPSGKSALNAYEPPQRPQQTTSGTAGTQLSQVAPGIGIMVTLGGSYSLIDGNLYRLSEDDSAAQFLENTFTGQIECVDQTGSACSVADAPPAPAPDPAQIQRASIAQACTFLTGGLLQPLHYTQLSYLSPVPYDYTWKQYTYHYSVSPTSATALAPLTGWKFVKKQEHNPAGTPTVSVTGSIVNEFVTFPKPGEPMYAFMAGNFISDLHLAIRIGGVDQTLKVQLRTAQNCPGCLRGQDGAVDFTFSPNAGMYSPYTGSLGDAMWRVKPGDARTILNSDGYTANDDGGPNGSALQLGILHAQSVTLGPGSYQLILTGTSSGIAFESESQLRIISPTCAMR